MRTTLNRFWLLPLFLALSVFDFPTPLARAQGTAFTYQGRLNDGGNPASGSYDFRFRLASDPLANNYLGNNILTNGVTVTNGLLTVALDFGAGIFTGSNYWLEVDVRTNGAGSYVVLTPLQPVTPAPYAIMANSASNLLGNLPAAQLNGSLANANLPASPTFSGTVAASSFSGSGAGLTSVNAASLGGLNATNLWQVGGNSVSAGQFLGSVNNQALEFRINGNRALLLTTNASDAPNFIAGSPANFIDAGVRGAVIAGGGTTNLNSSSNQISSDFSSIGGGSGNWIQDNADHSVIGNGWNNVITEESLQSVIAGGISNTIAGPYTVIGGGIFNTNSSGWGTIGGGFANAIKGLGFSTVAGGIHNVAARQASTVGGGSFNNAGADYSTVSGGRNNTIATADLNSVIAGGAGNFVSGFESTISGGGENSAAGNDAVVGGGSSNTNNGTLAVIPGGYANLANGQSSFAAGRQAQALHDGAFVWADSQSTGFSSTANDQFLVLAHGGVGINKNNPGTALDVNGTVTATSFTGNGANLASLNANNLSSGTVPNGRLPSNVAFLDGTPGFTSQVTTFAGLRLSNTNIWFRDGADTFHGLGWYGSGKPFAGLAPDGPVLFGFAGGILGTTSSGQQAILAWNNTGVGIGTNAPAASLHIVSGGGISQPQLRLDQTNNNDYARLRFKAVTNGVWDIAAGGGPANTMNFFAGSQSGLPGTNVLILNPNGNATLFGTLTQGSDRARKEHFHSVDPEAVLAKVAALSITTWNYKTSPEAEHLGPVAQDFHEAFGLNGADDKGITTVDEGGVALAAIQGLNQKLVEKDAKIQKLEAQNDSLSQRLAALEATVRTMAR
jgi:hypothetical protein